MTTHPKYPHRRYDTGQLLRSLVIAAIMLAVLLALTSCGYPLTASLTYRFPDSGAKAGLSVTIPKARIVHPTK